MTNPFPMERVLYNLHHKCCQAALQHTTRRSRSWAEHTVLVLAVCGFAALLTSHLTFCHRPTMRSPIPRTCLTLIPGFSKHADVTHVLLLRRNDDGEYGQSRVTAAPLGRVGGAMSDQSCDQSCRWHSDRIIFSFSHEKGYLFLPADLLDQAHGVSQQYAHVSPTDAHCFGEPFLQRLVHNLIGPETVVLNWLLGTWDATGYIYNPRTRLVYDLQQYKAEQQHLPFGVRRKIQELALKLFVVIKTCFLFFITTTLVSFTLRETQGRMLDFTHHLQEHVRSRRPVVSLVTRHVAENLVFVPIMVGMIFFLIEFYRGDKFLAFMVLSLVWICESFSVVSLRTKQGIHFFPRIFFLLFALFHFYNFSFPFGFSYSAFASSLCFMVHSMLFFWHRYELPAVVLGRVSPDFPRQTVISPASRQLSTPVPQPRRSFGRTLSSNTAASDRMSRNSSINGLFHQGDDDDDSYQYMLGGEVVMHSHSSPRAPSTLPTEIDPALTEPRRNTRSSRQSGPRFLTELDTLVAAGSGEESVSLSSPTRDDDDPNSTLQVILNVSEEEAIFASDFLVTSHLRHPSEINLDELDNE